MAQFDSYESETIAAIKAQVTALQASVDNVDIAVAGIDTAVAGIDASVVDLDATIDLLKDTDVSNLDAKVVDLDADIVALQASMNSSFNNLATEEFKNAAVIVLEKNASGSSYSDVVNVTGSGYLILVAQTCKSDNKGSLIITIDGVDIYNEDGADKDRSLMYSLPLLIRYESSLRVQHKGVLTTTNIIETVVQYIPD